ncbi:MAG TPA: PqqD family protein [Natronosporangium sp.]|nr:PqqD family protein [Natronosporangium sp.]
MRSVRTVQLVPPLDIDVRDTVRFPHCTVEADGVRDHLSGALIRVNAVGRRVVDLCDGTRTVGNVVDALADQFGVARDRILADLMAFLDAMERRGLIRVRRHLWTRMSPPALLHRALQLLSLQVTRTERRRYPVTPGGCAAATVRATRLPMWLGLLCAPPMAYVIAVQPTIGVPTAVLAAAVPLAAVAFVQATVWLHELGHLLALPAEVRRRAYFTARTMLVTLSFDPAPPVNARWVAAAGPLWAVLGCVLASAALSTVDLPAGLPLVPLVIALAHLASLTPWARDGRLFLAGGPAADMEDAHVA